MTQTPQKQKKSKIGLILLLVLFLLLIAGGVASAVWIFGGRSVDWSQFRPTTPSLQPLPVETGELPSNERPSNETSETDETDPVPTTTEATDPAAAIPVDFEALWQINPDVYAWIYIPNTWIDLPILQSGPDEIDNYYLHKNIYREYEYKGCLYTQKQNSKDFLDPVTVIYGHNMLNGTMFSNLDKFYDETFFNENRYFYIYTPDRILTYEIVSAHQYDTRHILNSFDFSKPDVFQKYLDMILNPRTFLCHVREGIELTTEDRIVTLSTCISHGANRFLVQGVLINDEHVEP